MKNDSYDEALEYVAEQLGVFFKDDPKKAVYWLMTPNPMLGNIVPAWLMLSHPRGPQKLKSFVQNAIEGNIP